MPKKTPPKGMSLGQMRQAQKALKDAKRAWKGVAASSLAQSRPSRVLSNPKGDAVARSSGGESIVYGGTRVAVRSRARPHYRMEIEWSAEDDAYVVTVPDLPGCMTHGATYAEAAAKGEGAIDAWLRAARYWGTPIPLPGSSSPSAR